MKDLKKVCTVAGISWVLLGLYQTVDLFLGFGGLNGIFNMIYYGAVGSIIYNIFCYVSNFAAIVVGYKFITDKKMNMWVPLFIAGIWNIEAVINDLEFGVFSYGCFVSFLIYVCVALMYSPFKVPFLEKFWFAPGIAMALNYLIFGNIAYINWIVFVFEIAALLTAGYFVHITGDENIKTKKINWSKVGVTIFVIAFIVITIICFAGGSGSNDDIGRDPNGFLGYSDDFWDWYMDHGYIA